MPAVNAEELLKLHSQYSKCTDCSLHRHGSKLYSGGVRGGSSSDIVLLTGQQFPDEVHGGVFGLGVIREMLETLGGMLDHNFNAYPITGVVKCPTTPPEDAGSFGHEICAKPRPAEFKACRRWLYAELTIHSPLLVICLGETALAAIAKNKIDFGANLGIATDALVDGELVEYPLAVLPTFGVLDLIRSTDMTEGSVWHRAYEHFQTALLIIQRLRENT